VAGRRRGRVEDALDRELSDHPEVSIGERAMLRAQARAVDVAEANRDSDAVTTASRGYLDVRRAVGLTGANAAVADPFDALLQELSHPRVGNPAES
jgi:hypothetical protein